MELSGRDFDRIPRRNLRVRVSEFARLWLTVERRADALEAEGQAEDSYLVGVQSTCRWLAGVIITVNGPSGPAPAWSPSPITGERQKAYEELIAEEAQAAEQAMIGRLPGRPGFRVRTRTDPSCWLWWIRPRSVMSWRPPRRPPGRQ
jgi:hypothetical protein